MIVTMLQNWINRYSSHYRIIKYVGFEPIHYVINLDVVSSFKVFNKFDCMFLSNYIYKDCLPCSKSIILYFVQKNVYWR